MAARVLVTGGGGFIGHHLVRSLKTAGFWVRAVDLHCPTYETSAADDFQLLDLRTREACAVAVRGVQHVYHLAANMGGIGYIETHKAEITRDSTLINMHMLEAARVAGVTKFLFTSSACVYPAGKQDTVEARGLRESDAYPADAEDGYGWEKLFMERACRHFREDYGLVTYIARFHNIYGPLGAFQGGREKSPAAICRKVALAGDGGEIEVWGDGEQTRSYCYVDDCVQGLMRLMASEFYDPINIGQDRMVTINQLVDMVCAIAGKTLHKRHVQGPLGVRGRNSDNTLLRATLGWEPHTALEEGLVTTYEWIASRVSTP